MRIDSRRSTTPTPVHTLLPVCLLVLLAHCSLAEKESNISYGVPWGMCSAPIPEVVTETTGAVTDDVLALCLRSTNPTTTFENAEKMFIGNSSNSAVKAFGTLCAKITQEYIFAVQDPTDASQPYTFLPAEGFPIGDFGKQAWEISLWDVRNANDNTTVDLTVSNFGPTDLEITGIDFASYGLDSDTYFPIGNVTTLNLNLKEVAKNITYEGLPILQEFLVSGYQALPENTPTALIFVRPYGNQSDPEVSMTQVAYAIAKDKGGSVPVSDQFSFFLYETVQTKNLAGSGRRRLLVATAKNKAPPTACAKGCCKPASPVPKGCAKGAATWPNCQKTCGCACK